MPDPLSPTCNAWSTHFFTRVRRGRFAADSNPTLAGRCILCFCSRGSVLSFPGIVFARVLFPSVADGPSFSQLLGKHGVFPFSRRSGYNSSFFFVFDRIALVLSPCEPSPSGSLCSDRSPLPRTFVCEFLSLCHRRFSPQMANSFLIYSSAEVCLRRWCLNLSALLAQFCKPLLHMFLFFLIDFLAPLA